MAIRKRSTWFCISLDKLLNKIELQQNVVGAIVDLTQTGYLLTVLFWAYLQNWGLSLNITNYIQAVMLSTNPDITTLANSMGLGQVFVILNYCGDPNVCTLELTEEHVTHSAMLNTVLDAHKTLMRLNENNQNMFEPLVKQLQKEQECLSLDSQNKMHNC